MLIRLELIFMTFEKGKSGNPAGRQATGLQELSTRLQYWLTNKTVGEIENMVKNKAGWKKLVAIDGVLVRRIDSALRRSGSNPDFTAVLDRFVGRPVQPIAAEFKVTHGLADRIERARKIAVSGVPEATLSNTVTIEQQVIEVATDAADDNNT